MKELCVSSHPLDAAASVPDVATYIERYAERSRRARENFHVQRNLAYGAGGAERLDYFPAGSGTPIAVFFHGGYWRRLDKDDFSFIASGLVPNGIAFASVNYSLAPETRLVDIIEQCRRAVTWIAANAATLDIDRERISVFGHSAGGHLSAMAAIAVPVHALITLSGLHDLAPVQRSFANEWLQLSEDEARELSPIAYRPAKRCGLYATTGALESPEFKAQGRSLIAAWSAYCPQARYEDSLGDHHFSICDRLAEPTDPLTQEIVSLVR